MSRLILSSFLVATFVLGSFSLPFENGDEDTVVILPAELVDEGLNDVDGGDEIDVSHLGPAAYGLPNNESGEYLFMKYVLVFTNIIARRQKIHVGSMERGLKNTTPNCESFIWQDDIYYCHL